MTSTPPTQAYSDEFYSYTVRAVDPEGGILNYSLTATDGSGNPVTVNPPTLNNGVVRWTPDLS